MSKIVLGYYLISKLTASPNNILLIPLSGCLNAQNEDDSDPYTSTSSNGADKMQNISENNTNNCNENGAEKFALRKNFVPDNTTTKPLRSFLGQCKPGILVYVNMKYIIMIGYNGI